MSNMTPTPADTERVVALRYLYEADQKAFAGHLSDLIKNAEAMRDHPSLSNLTAIENTCTELWWRLTRIRMAEETLS